MAPSPAIHSTPPTRTPLRRGPDALWQWLHWGSADTHRATLQRKAFHVNAAAFLTLVILVAFGIAYEFTGNAALHQALLNQLPVAPIVLLIPWLNRRGHFHLTPWLLLLSVMAMLLAAVRNSSGSALDLHFMFIVLVIGAITLLPARHWPGIVVMVVAAIAAFGYCEFIGVAPQPALLTLDPATALGFRIAYVGTSVFTVAIVVVVGEYATRTNERELETLSGIDALTGLANRRRVEHRLDEAIATSTRIRQYAGLLYFDLDHFKHLNDTHGHDAGDLLLREVARRMRTMVRAMDLPARLGGDEFVVILTHLGADADAATGRIALVADKLCALLAEPYQLSVQGAPVTHRCTASIGAVRFHGTDQGVTPETLLHRGDAAMYHAKSDGGNRVCMATD